MLCVENNCIIVMISVHLGSTGQPSVVVGREPAHGGCARVDGRGDRQVELGAQPCTSLLANVHLSCTTCEGAALIHDMRLCCMLFVAPDTYQ